MDFHGIDLNLLAAFDALFAERNVTRAAARVGVSQPAMSAALSRLRTLMGDPLFLRSADGLLPTPRARDLAVPIGEALRRIESALVRKPAFEPRDAALTFSLGLSDYPAFVLLPALQGALEKQAPGVSLSVRAFTARDNAVDLLDAGTIDAAIGVPPTQSDGRILSRPVLQDEFVTMVRSGHPAARRGMDLEAFLAAGHLLVSPEGDRHGLVDEALARLGKSRRLALTLPQMFAAPAVVAQTDLIGTVMKRVAQASAASHQLVLFPPPIHLDPIRFELIWHRRNDSHSGQQWFRSLVAELAASLDSNPTGAAVHR
jgi:DNA-binding transcriptional LysR family regulator